MNDNTTNISEKDQERLLFLQEKCALCDLARCSPRHCSINKKIEEIINKYYT